MLSDMEYCLLSRNFNSIFLGVLPDKMSLVVRNYKRRYTKLNIKCVELFSFLVFFYNYKKMFLNIYLLFA